MNDDESIMVPLMNIEVIGKLLFTPGTVIGNLENGGVGLAPYHEADSSIPQDVKDQVDAVKQGIINGEINVWQPYWTLIYLPAILK